MRLAHRRRLISVIGSGIVLTVLLVVGLYGLLWAGPGGNEPTQPQEASMSLRAPVLAARPRPILETSDPAEFAIRVARALLTWDTRYTGDSSKWEQVVVDAADAAEAVAVASDVRAYLPAPSMWKRLAAYGTRQRFELQSLRLPSTWSTALEQATPGQIPSGAAAVTVVGTRHREGLWKTEDVRTTRAVAFTVFAVCPQGHSCKLLRLSLPDRPLP